MSAANAAPGFFSYLVAIVCGSACVAPATPNVVREEQPREAAEPRQRMLVRKLDDTVAYDGELTLPGLAELKRAASDPHVSILMIRSEGGGVGVGMDFGEWLWTRKLSVVVQDYCLSSCANYVFPAAVRKAILEGGVVAWHGSARQRDQERELDAAIARLGARGSELVCLRANAIAEFAALRVRQDAFFATVGVNECITRIGIERLGAGGLFFMSVRDMGRFGVSNVLLGPADERAVPVELRHRLGLSFVRVPDDLDLAHACP